MPHRRPHANRGKRKLPVVLGVPMAAGLALGVGAVLVFARKEPPRLGPSARRERSSSKRSRGSSSVPRQGNRAKHGEVESPQRSDAPASMPLRSQAVPGGATRGPSDIERRASSAAPSVPAVHVAVEGQGGASASLPKESLEPAGRDRKADEAFFANLRRESEERAAALALGTLKQPAGTEPLRGVPRVSEPASELEVLSFTLINADTDQPIAGFDPLPDGATLDLSRLPTRNLNVRANTAPDEVGSVRFRLNGKLKPKEEFAPYALAADTEGDYKAWTPRPGTYTLTATPYVSNSARGKTGKECTIKFNVIDTKGGRR